MSNIILSDEEIARKERIIEVPALSVETDMKDNGDGMVSEEFVVDDIPVALSPE